MEGIEREGDKQRQSREAGPGIPGGELRPNRKKKQKEKKEPHSSQSKKPKPKENPDLNSNGNEGG